MSLSAQLASRVTGGWNRLCIISPHLDDAAFSTFAMLKAPVGESRCVVSVITEHGLSGGTQWARAAGFKDPAAEFRARQEEDRRALATLGVDTRHLGVGTGSSPAQLEAAIRGYLQGEADAIGSTLYLLPGGAGGKLPPDGIARFVARVLRRPAGTAAHPEHVAVRNQFVDALRSQPNARFGFYGEQPYIWNDTIPRLRRELELLSGLSLMPIQEQPEVDSKLELARMYASQFPLIFGDKVDFQRRVLRRAEEYYLPA
jgi:LmbE family N-acetylglucosaminyl deacetylase